VVAHRAGNELARLRRAESLPVRLVEADVHLFAGRLEVRHFKTLGPVPILWDRWGTQLAAPWAPRLLLEELLDAAAPQTELMLDLKTGGVRLAERVAELVRGRPGVRVCSQHWRLLAPLAAAGVPVVHSVGGRRALRALPERVDGLSIHRKLLDRDVVAGLRERTGTILTWPVATAAEARELGEWGVDGVITDNFAELAAA
jgi:hypothetical protein